MNDPMPEIRRILNMPAHDTTNSHGWANGHPADITDYKADAREAALRGDNVRANYFASMALLQQQKALVEQAHLSNLIAYWTAMTDTTAGQLEPDAEDALTELYGQITKRLGLR
jgi:hypothetical protein